MILIQIHSIHKTELSITLKYHLFEVVTFKILDLKGHRYEIIGLFMLVMGFLDLDDMIFFEIHYIHKKKLSLTSKYH